MPVKISAELRQRLLNQKKAMGSGLLIDNKTLTKARYRILPVVGTDEVPGKEYTSFYCDSIGKKGTTSPQTFGKPCPIMDALNRIRTTGDKDTKDFAKDFVNIQSEYWMGVLDQDDPGTAEHMNIRILRAKKRVYGAIIDAMCDEDDGENITDPIEGRDIRVKKEGSGKDTEWTVKFLDRGPVSNDQAFVDAFVAAAEKFDPTEKFYAVDWKILGEIYKGLTGESEIPASYMEESGVDESGNSTGKGGKISRPVAKPVARPGNAPAAKQKPEPEPEPDEPEEPEAAAEFEPGTKVEFKDADGNVIQGEVLKVSDDNPDNYDVKDMNGEPWGVSKEDLTVIEEPEEEPEEEAPPAVKKAGPTKKPAATPQPAPKAGTARKPVANNKASLSIKERLAKAKG